MLMQTINFIRATVIITASGLMDEFVFLTFLAFRVCQHIPERAEGIDRFTKVFRYHSSGMRTYTHAHMHARTCTCARAHMMHTHACMYTCASNPSNG